MKANSFYVTGGTLRHDARCYVERKADTDLLDALLHGEFCYVLTSRQMGKSSLMVRTATKLRERGITVVVLDLTALGQNLTPEQWYDGMMTRLGRELGLETELEEFCQQNARLSPVQRAFAALRDVVLRKRSTPVVIFVDEIDTVRSLPFSTDEFFAAIRECYNRRTDDAELRRLTFCLLGVGTPSDLIRDARLTPFNIGRRIELNDFSGHEALPLAAGLLGGPGPIPAPASSQRADLPASAPTSVTPQASVLLQRVLFWTNGHPYLTQRLCHAVTESALPLEKATVDRCCAELFFTSRARERDDNLLFVRERLLHNEMDRTSLLQFYEQTLTRRGVADDETNPLAGVLRLAGVMRRDGNRLQVRNRIYARVFNQVWIKANLPDSEKRRQREAYYRGIVRTASVAAMVVLVMAGLVVMALRSRAQARNATWAALRNQARWSRVSGLPGQRFAALDSIRQAAAIKSSPELRDEAIACLALPDLRRHNVSTPPTGAESWGEGARALVFSDDLQLCAFATAAGEAVVRAVAENRETSRWRCWSEGFSHSVARIWFSHDNRYLAIAHTNDDLTALSLWDRQAGASGSPPELLFAFTNRMQMEAFAFSPDNSCVAVGSEGGAARILTLPEGKLRAEADVSRSCSALTFDPANRWLAVASSESLTIGLYDVASGNLITTLHSASPPKCLAWHPHGHLLAGAGEDHRIRLWEIDPSVSLSLSGGEGGGEAADEFPREESPQQMSDITALGFSHSGGLLASASADQTLRLWEPGSGRLLLTLAESGSVPQLQFSPDDRRLGFASSGPEVWFWEVAPGEECRTLFDFEADGLNDVDVHPEGRLLAAAHQNGVTLWDLSQLRSPGRMPVGKTSGLRFQPASGDLFSAEFRGTYSFGIKTEAHTLTQAGEGKQERTGELLRLEPNQNFYLGPGAVALDVARDADVLAVAYDDRIRLARNTNSAYAGLGELIGEPGFKSVAVSPDGRQVAAGNWRLGDVWLWEPAASAKPRRLRADGRARLRFSPDGRWLAMGTERMGMLWDAHSWQPTIRIERPRGATHPAPVAFASNSRIWAVALTDSRVRLLEVDGNTIADLEPPQKHFVNALAFSPDGSQLTSATSAKTILVWDLAAVARALAQLGLDNNLKMASVGLLGQRLSSIAGAPQSDGGIRDQLPTLTVEIGALDRLRFSQAKHLLRLRRDIGELTDLIRRSPDDSLYYQRRAEKFRELGELEKAIEDYAQWIELDRATNSPTETTLRAWPLRDLAMVYLSAPGGAGNYEKALALTHQALELDAENPDNHFRHGIACYRLDRYEEAEEHFQASRRLRETAGKKPSAGNPAGALFYEAMCQARRNSLLATQTLEQAKAAYDRTDLKYRESHAQLSELMWEAQRVVSQSLSGAASAPPPGQGGGPG